MSFHYDVNMEFNCNKYVYTAALKERFRLESMKKYAIGFKCR